MIEFVENETREHVCTCLSRMSGSKEEQDRYLDELFCDYPDIDNFTEFSDITMKSKRDKPVVISFPKKMTIEEAYTAGKVKTYTLSFEQEQNIMAAIKQHQEYEFLGYTPWHSSHRPYRKILKKWAETGRRTDIYDFPFLCTWFKNINLDSRVNKYMFVRIAGGATIERACMLKNRHLSNKFSNSEGHFTIYIDDTSPTKDPIPKNIEAKIIHDIYLSNIDLYRCFKSRYMVFFNMYHCGSETMHQMSKSVDTAPCPLERYYRSLTRDKTSYKQFLYLGDYNVTEYSIKNTMQKLSLACLLTVPAPNSHYGAHIDSEYNDIIEDLRHHIESNKFFTNIPHIKNASFEVWYIYYVMSKVLYSKFAYSSGNNYEVFDRWQIDTAMKIIYQKLSYKIFGKGVLPSEFFKNYDGFGKNAVREMEKAGHIFYDSVFAQNYIDNIIKLVLPTCLIAYDASLQNDIAQAKILQTNLRTAFYVNKSGDIFATTEGDSHNTNCSFSVKTKDAVITFGDKYSIKDDLDDLDRNYLRDVITYSGALEDKLILCRNLLFKGLLPVFDKSRLSIVDLFTWEEVHCIIDLSKEVI